MIFFIRSFIADFDGKIQKYFSALKTANIQFHYVGWSRGNVTKTNNKDETFYQRKAPLGNGIKNIYNILLWNLFIFSTLIKNRKKIKVVHAIDFDSGLSTWLFCILFKKKFIFDVYDKYTDVRKFPQKLITLIDKLEIYLINKSDLTILADENRYGQHGLPISNRNIIVLENVPSVSNISNIILKEISSNINIGYFGVLEANNRGLEDLALTIQKHPNIFLHVVGYGPLSDFMNKISKNHENIIFYGSKTAEEGLNIMKEMDILVGMYYKTVKNHLFAAPNKYYEHLMLARPLLTTIDTPPGKKVLEHDTGWAIEEGQDTLDSWLKSLNNHEEIVTKAFNAGELWKIKYSNYFHKYYEGLYINRIRSFISD